MSTCSVASGKPGTGTARCGSGASGDRPGGISRTGPGPGRGALPRPTLAREGLWPGRGRGVVRPGRGGVVGVLFPVPGSGGPGLSRGKGVSGMIGYADEALESLIRQALGPDNDDLEITFEAPVKENVSPEPFQPVIDVYLYDLHERIEQRQAGSVPLYGEPPRWFPPGRARQVSSHDPVRYLQLSYMLTVWAQRIQDAHEVLGALFSHLARQPVLLVEIGPFTVAGNDVPWQQVPAGLTVGRPAADNRILTELWSSFENRLTPFLNITVTLPMPTTLPVPSAQPVEWVNLAHTEFPRPKKGRPRVKEHWSLPQPVLPLPYPDPPGTDGPFPGTSRSQPPDGAARPPGADSGRQAGTELPPEPEPGAGAAGPGRGRPTAPGAAVNGPPAPRADQEPRGEGEAW